MLKEWTFQTCIFLLYPSPPDLPSLFCNSAMSFPSLDTCSLVLHFIKIWRFFINSNTFYLSLNLKHILMSQCRVLSSLNQHFLSLFIFNSLTHFCYHTVCNWYISQYVQMHIRFDKQMKTVDQNLIANVP